MTDRLRKVFIIAGEVSGDALGAKLMEAMRARLGNKVSFEGVGGEAMAGEGLTSLFDMHDIAVMGFSAVIARLPTLITRINRTAEAVLDAKPDILVIIDSPDFTHRVARKVRAVRPDIPVVDYVCPSVWAWRSSRARAMRAYVDHVLALLPFEPKTLETLNGPKATYVGHPLFSTFPARKKGERAAHEKRRLLILPGSRRGEVSRLLPLFNETLKELHQRRSDLDLVLPAVPRLLPLIEASVRDWPVQPKIVTTPAEKIAAFACADAALAASGTVCLELALAGVPMISTYKLDPIARRLRFLVTTWSANLPNLIVDYPVVPEYIDEFIKPAGLARLLDRLLSDTPERAAQLAAFATIRSLMATPGDKAPADMAADTIIAMMRA
ncbi:MAG: lipid-A-disaccharide synthase [Rhizobiales bacterium]|nr:lipid-A-disaccharide synthase [Hyphomicrobiales bacterium]